jgi:hypothetical protein
MTTRLAFSLACAALLAGCATEYQPHNSEGGYSEALVEPGVWRVKFAATPYTLQHQIQDFSLLRSAELTLQQGYSHFTLAAPDGKASARPGPDVVVRMARQSTKEGAVQYDARAVCSQLGARYEVTCHERPQ